MQKDKLSISDQITYMREKKGIKFNIVNEESAKIFLTSNNYYFKIKSFAKNYENYTSGENVGKYINLEFAYLQELSTIDMYFRKFINKITLDIEHFLKTQLLKDFANNDEEDGYSIVKEFLVAYPYIEKNISDKSRNSACSDLVQKYEGNFAIWNIVEVLSFGDYIKLYSLYYKKYPTPSSMNNYLWSVKFLRNAAAHNNCLIYSLKKPYTTSNINKEINTLISKIPGIYPDTRIRKMANPIIHDFIVTLYVFNSIVSSEQIKKHSMSELKVLMDSRLTRNKCYFEKNQLLVSYYKFIKKIVDYFYAKCI